MQKINRINLKAGLVVAGLTFLSTMSIASAEVVAKGKKFSVTSHRWAKLEVPLTYPIVGDRSNTFPVGHSCALEEGGTIEVLGFSGDNSKALVRYTGKRTMGVLCLTGSIVFLTVDEVSKYEDITAKLLAIQAAKERYEEAARIRQEELRKNNFTPSPEVEQILKDFQGNAAR